VNLTGDARADRPGRLSAKIDAEFLENLGTENAGAIEGRNRTTFFGSENAGIAQQISVELQCDIRLHIVC
jgi:hypothetical protein